MSKYRYFRLDEDEEGQTLGSVYFTEWTGEDNTRTVEVHKNNIWIRSDLPSPHRKTRPLGETKLSSAILMLEISDEEFETVWHEAANHCGQYSVSEDPYLSFPKMAQWCAYQAALRDKAEDE